MVEIRVSGYATRGSEKNESEMMMQVATDGMKMMSMIRGEQEASQMMSGMYDRLDVGYLDQNDEDDEDDFDGGDDCVDVRSKFYHRMGEPLSPDVAPDDDENDEDVFDCYRRWLFELKWYQMTMRTSL